MATKTYEILTHQLGNVRVTFTEGDNGQAEIIQEDHYYPFGLRMSGQHFTNTDLLNKFLYNGKELQDQTGYYDYGFRQMDPALGRWFVTDALAESYYSESPYSYASDNPINNIDIAGLASTELVNPGFNDEVWAMITNGWENTPEGEDWSYTYSGGEVVHSTQVEAYNGILIGGNSQFKAAVKRALLKVDATWLGSLVIQTCADFGTWNPLQILDWENRPDSEEYQAVSNSFYYNNTIWFRLELSFYAEIKGIFSDAEVSGERFINLGHELFHAYLDRIIKEDLPRSDNEQAAIGFENYLASVHGIDHIRRQYDGERLWDVRREHDFFNPYSEKVMYVPYDGNQENFSRIDSYGMMYVNSLSAMPVPYSSVTFLGSFYYTPPWYTILK